MHPPMEEWVRCQAIGQGSSANVSLAKPANPSSRFPPLIAVKSCHVAKSSSLKNEFTILNELKGCLEIVECYGECFTVENSERLYNVVLEYACGGSLADKMKSSENLRLSESVVRRYTKSILKGLQFIHRRGFVHCDIKLQNVLVFSGDNVKIADFGLAKKVAAAEDGFGTKYEVRGTPLYMSPETVAGGEQGPAADSWAVGCVVSEMITGKPAWRCTDIGALLMKIGFSDDIPVIPGKLSDAGKDFLRRCFEKDVSKRWTAEMLLNHPFMDGEDEFVSNSPRNPFDFPEWESEQSDMVTVTTTTTKSFCSPELESWTGVEAGVSGASRLQQLVVEERPDWFFTSSWITVREPHVSSCVYSC